MIILRQLILGLTLLAHSLSIAHSLIPHHHFNSLSEYKSAHTQDENEQNNHGHNNQNGETSDTGLFFLTHTTNIDFLPSTIVPSKEIVSEDFQANNTVLQSSLLIEAWFVNKVFHIPINPPRRDYTLFSSRILRAPPILS